MTNWMEGYSTTEPYTKTYFRELNPNYAAFSLLCAGIQPPKIKAACELGFGFGMSINHHASTQKINWYGNDYNPTQKNFAQYISTLCNSGAVLTEKSFAQLSGNCDWPKFDYIALHGIWSWISEENQAYITDFIAEHLSDDGVVYISYNVSPGALAFSPVRDLMKQHFDYGTAKGDSLKKRVNETLNFLDGFQKTAVKYMANNPLVQKRINDLKDHTPVYLLHEYLNEDWNTENFLTMSEKLADIKLEFCCSANFLSTVGSLNFTSEQNEFLNSIPNKATKEYLTDLYWVESFRKDYWVKGPRRLSKQSQWEQIKNFEVIQLKPREDISKEISGRVHIGRIDNDVYRGVMKLIEDSTTISINDIAAIITSSNPQGSAIESTRVLLALGYIGIVTNDNFVESRSTALCINDIMCRESIKYENAVTYLCSPRTGDALPLSRSTLIYLHARQSGHDSFEEACLAVVRKCAENNEVFQHEGKVFKTESDAHEFIMSEVGKIIDNYGSILAKHGIVLGR